MFVRTHIYKGVSFSVFYHEDILTKLPKGTLYFNGKHWSYKGFRSYHLFHILHLPNHTKGTYHTTAPLNEESVLFLASFIKTEDKNKFLKVLLSNFPQFYSVVYNLYYPNKKLPDDFVIPDSKYAILVNEVRHLQKLQKQLLSSNNIDISDRGHRLYSRYCNKEEYNKDINKGIIYKQDTQFLIPLSFLVDLFGKRSIIKKLLVKYHISSPIYVKGKYIPLRSSEGVCLIPIDYVKLNQTIMQLLKQISGIDSNTYVFTDIDNNINTSVDVDINDTYKESMQIEYIDDVDDIDDNTEEYTTNENITNVNSTNGNITNEYTKETITEEYTTEENTNKNTIKPISTKEPVGLNDVYILNKDTNVYIHLSNCTKIDVLKTVVEQNTSNVLVLTKSDIDKSFQNLQLLK